jgi:hypothetical protein
MKKTRSPGRALALDTRIVAAYCWATVRGRVLPARAYAHFVSPEQSNREGPALPYR